MRKSPSNKQSGYVLLLTLLAFMGIGGAVMVGYTQGAKKEAEHARYMHNVRVLNEAKQALLQYAYNYPVTSGFGPGRMPCPDTDNDGIPDPSFYCINGNAIVGRLPWFDSDLDFYDARDASGERLWYAVSRNFANTGPLVSINSDTTGTITIHDQTGALVYDGLGAGVAAVIIAPGPTIDRNGVLQDRSVANGDDPEGIIADTDPGIVDPVNYLDLFGALDNADFINSNSGDGFVVGPVDDLAAEELIVNDQMVVITAEEVIAMAEKATLQAYQTAINDYNANMTASGADVYPWLDDYATQITTLTDYDGDVGIRNGRVPSIFANYFAVNESQLIRSELTMLMNVDGHPVSTRAPASALPDVKFDTDGDLSTSFNNGASFVGYVWDGHLFNVPTLPNDGIWEACPYVTGTDDDCNQDVLGDFIGMGGIVPGDSDVWLQVREVTFTFNGGSPFEFPRNRLTATPLVYTPPNAVEHAYVTAEYEGDGSVFIASVTWSQDDDFKSSFTEFPLGNNGSLTFNNGDFITVGMRYYPELPNWALAAQDNWHDSIQFTYAAGFQPGVVVACTPGTDCLQVNNSAGITDNKSAVTVLASDHNFNDGDNDGFDDELDDIFDPENDDSDDVFDAWANNGTGNDKILVIR